MNTNSLTKLMSSFLNPILLSSFTSAIFYFEMKNKCTEEDNKEHKSKNKQKEKIA